MTSGFHSHWRSDLTTFLAYRRAFGGSYGQHEVVLRNFDQFAAAHPDASIQDTINHRLVQSTHAKPASIATYVRIVRQFCLFLRRSDPNTFVPDRVAPVASAAPCFKPVVLSRIQVHRLLKETRQAGPAIEQARIRILLLVLYCTGLRIGEALRLKLADVDLEERCFRIAPSKGRSRVVPFRRDLARELDRWLRLREHTGFVLGPQTTLFEDGSGRPARYREVYERLVGLFRTLGLKPDRGRLGLRIHDLRHTFCIHRLEAWYRSRQQPDPLLPFLSAYLGHLNLSGTERYLRATPTLLATAAQRFRRSLDLKGPSA
jgi:integrase